MSERIVSIQLVSPASGDEEFVEDLHRRKMVSIQLVSPASGDSGQPSYGISILLGVSIQLVSPASGDS